MSRVDDMRMIFMFFCDEDMKNQDVSLVCVQKYIGRVFIQRGHKVKVVFNANHM